MPSALTTGPANRTQSSESWLKKCRELPPRSNGRQLKLKQLGLPLHKGPGDLAKGQDVFLDQLSELPRDLKSIPRRILPRSADTIAARLKRKSCAIVGNSGNVLLASHGRDIDGHDVVFRVNQGPTAGFEANVGRKTHFRLLNAWWTENYAGAYDLKKLPLERNVVLVASRGDTLARNFKKLGARMASEDRRDVTATILNLSALARTRQLLRIFRKCLEATGQKYRGGIAPTSGLVLITSVMDLCQKTSVYGFGDDKVRGRTPKYQYYGGKDARASGNPTHSFETELNLVHALASNNYIRFCAAGICRGSGTNKSRK